jgi:hypothetical protein
MSQKYHEPVERKSPRTATLVKKAMVDSQIYTALLAGIPTMLSVLIGILINNSRLSDVNARLAT